MPGSRRGISASSCSDCRRFDKNRIDAELGERAGALDGVVEAIDAARVGARDDDEIGIGARRQRGFEFSFHLRQWDDFFAVEMAAALGRDLVLDMNGSDANAFELTHGAHQIDGIAVAGVGIGDHRNFHHRDDLRCPFDGFRHAHQANVRDAHAPGDRAAAEIRRFVAGFLDKPRRKAVEAAGRDEELIALQQFFEGLPWTHVIPQMS